MNANAKKAGKFISHTCPFCRELEPSGEEYLRQLEVRASLGDYEACDELGTSYADGGIKGAQIDKIKSLHYFILAAELGSEAACAKIASKLEKGMGVPVDKSKAALFYKIGALRGHIISRWCVAMAEYDHGNHEVGIRHFKIAAEAGMQPALDELKKIFSANGKLPGKEFISKEELDTIYRMCHEAQEDIKSEEREKHFTEEEKRRGWTQC